nr:MAG TPA: hypothetical protein [Caudoviricetes sp.]
MTAICFKCGHPSHDGSCVNVAPQQPTAQPFTVVAGKLEGDGERNYKYVESFADVMDAVRALDTCKGYHFAEIEYRAAPPAPVGGAHNMPQRLLTALIEAEKKLVELENSVGGGDDEIYIEGTILNVRAAIADALHIQSAPLNEGGSEPVRRFDLDADGSMDEFRDGRWVRYEDHCKAAAPQPSIHTATRERQCAEKYEDLRKDFDKKMAERRANPLIAHFEQPSAKALTDERILDIASDHFRYEVTGEAAISFARALLVAEQPSEDKRAAALEEAAMICESPDAIDADDCAALIRAAIAKGEGHE